ncbi:unnamed protein product, partial [Ixodes persulcatus]
FAPLVRPSKVVRALRGENGFRVMSGVVVVVALPSCFLETSQRARRASAASVEEPSSRPNAAMRLDDARRKPGVPQERRESGPTPTSPERIGRSSAGGTPPLAVLCLCRRPRMPASDNGMG